MAGCDLGVPPPEVVAEGVPAVTAFLRRREEQGLARCFCARWIFVGFERVGKTSLSRALQGLAFDPRQRSTDGLGVSSYRLDAPALQDWLGREGPDLELPEEGEALEVGLWDLAGQSVYYLTHDFFLSPRAVYVLPWRCDKTPPPDAASGTNDHARSWRPRAAEERGSTDQLQLDHWLACLAARAPSATVVVVGTHAETADDGAPTLSAAERASLLSAGEASAVELRARYPGLRLEVALVDSSTGFGLGAARAALARLTLRGLSHALPLSVPRSWRELRERCRSAAEALQDREPPLLAWPGFEAGCGARCPRLREAVHFWHVLGDLWHFEAGQGACPEAPEDVGADSGRAEEDFVVLRPQWMADLLRCIVTQTGATEEIRWQGGAVGAAWLADRFEGAGVRGEAGLQSALGLLRRLELALPWRGAHLFPALLPPPSAGPPAAGGDGSGATAREVLLRLPARSVGLFARLLLRALDAGGMAPEGEMVAGRAALCSRDGGALVELGEGECAGGTELRLRARAASAGRPLAAPLGFLDRAAADEVARRRDDALRHAMAEAVTIVAASFPGRT